jgi:biopolymer transport protein ExbD
MSEILASTTDSRRRPGVGQVKRHSVRTDMTPMVDLGFLLITFFVFTAQLSEPKALKLNMPKEGDSSKLAESNAITVLLGDNDHVYYYKGNWEEASAKSEIFKTDLSLNGGLGKIIRTQQQWLDVNGKKEGRKGLMLLIKAGEEASYQMVIDALDQALINDVGKYALVRLEPEESMWMKAKE